MAFEFSRPWRAGTLVFLLVLGVATSAGSAGQMARAPREMGWIGLFSWRLIEWLENGNRLEQLCKEESEAANSRCRDAKLQPLPLVVPLHAGPTRNAASRGSLLVLATPLKGLRFFHVSTRGGSPREFVPDFTLEDWGYGPYYHQTYLERRGDWFLLPPDPVPAGTWINARDFGDEPHVLAVEAGRIYESPKGNILVLAVEADIVRATAEQDADMWCSAGEPPRRQPLPEWRIPKRSLYAPTGHLLLSLAYPKGC